MGRIDQKPQTSIVPIL